MPTRLLHPISTTITSAPLPATDETPVTSWRPVVTVEALVALTVVFLLATGNGPFWRALLVDRPMDQMATWGFALAIFLAFGAVCFFGAGLVATRHIVRPLLALLLLCTAFASFYMDRYAIYLDRAMMRNILATNVNEARDMMTWGLAAHVVLFGAVPAGLLWWPVIRTRRLARAFGVRLLWLAGALAVALASLFPVSADFASMMRNRKEVRYLMTPVNVVSALAGNAFARQKQPAGAKTPIGQDARLGAAWAHRARPMLFVVVVGETARAHNFSLNGYDRLTNPELAQRDMVNFSNTSSCGTSTEVSLPCMFSLFGRRHYDEDKIRGHESLLHVAARAGFQVIWRDNQSGCKGVCDGLTTQDMATMKKDAVCAEGECLDEILLHGMDQIARDASGNLLVVMHQMGSHGPAYFKRYPAISKTFSPACETAELRLCSAEEIVNAYDNSIVYTDHFLSQVVDFLSRVQDRYDTGMLYVSDHGESLGENGLYLHGVPYAIAPEVQTHVPMLVWLSPAFQKNVGVDTACLRASAAQARSHDNLFHSILGALDIQTSVYEKDEDLFAGCRVAAS